MPFARTKTTQSTVIERMIARIQAQTEFSSDTLCFDTVMPVPLHLPSADGFCTVSPGGGQFNVGGEEEPNSEAENSVVKVSIFVMVAADQAGREGVALRHATRGLLYFKKKVLKAFDKHDLLDGSGNAICRDLIHPIDCSEPDMVAEHPHVYMITLTFAVNFTWDLS